MSEREYFSIRYLIPGSIFILPILAYNIFPLYAFLSGSQVSVSLFGAILAVLGSPTIGFLVSQFWWEWRDSKLIPWEMGGGERLFIKLEEKGLKIKFPLNDKKNRKKALRIYDYVLHSQLHSNQEMIGLSNYVFRRYDNYVLLSCAKICLGLGALVGIISRFGGQVIYPNFTVGRNETIWLAIAFTATVLLIAIIRHGADRVKQDHKDIHEDIIGALFTDSEFDPTKLIEIFPEYFESMLSRISI